jgi:hypothetical protein
MPNPTLDEILHDISLPTWELPVPRGLVTVIDDKEFFVEFASPEEEDLLSPPDIELIMLVDAESGQKMAARIEEIDPSEARAFEQLRQQLNTIPATDQGLQAPRNRASYPVHPWSTL